MSHSFRIWWVFLYFFMKVWCVFFFQIFVCFLCVFFFLVKVHIAIHSFDLEAVFFFFVARKKNTAFSFIQSIFPQNVKKMNFYSKKKNTVPLVQDISSKTLHNSLFLQDHTALVPTSTQYEYLFVCLYVCVHGCVFGGRKLVFYPVCQIWQKNEIYLLFWSKEGGGYKIFGLTIRVKK